MKNEFKEPSPGDLFKLKSKTFALRVHNKCSLLYAKKNDLLLFVKKVEYNNLLYIMLYNNDLVEIHHAYLCDKIFAPIKK